MAASIAPAPGTVWLTLELTGAHHGQQGLVVAAFDTAGVCVGQLLYSVFASVLSVSHVIVAPAWRRQRVATQMYERMLAEHPGLPLGRNALTPEAAAFRDHFDTTHRPVRTGATRGTPRVAPVILTRFVAGGVRPH